MVYPNIRNVSLPYLRGLEIAVRKDSKDKFKPEGIRGQMKKNKKAYGYYWVRANEYESFLKLQL